MKRWLFLLLTATSLSLLGIGCATNTDTQPHVAKPTEPGGTLSPGTSGKPTKGTEQPPAPDRVTGIPIPLMGTYHFDKHHVFGQPKPTNLNRFKFTQPMSSSPAKNDGITVLAKKAHTLGHYDKYHVPAWVAIRWTFEDLKRSSANYRKARPEFTIDTDLPYYARANTQYFFSKYGYERGHMARNRDLWAWGIDAVKQGMQMSNVVPQKKGYGHVVWGDLEDAHRDLVLNPKIKTVWIVSGPIFKDDQAKEYVVQPPQKGNVDVEVKVGVPHATYKIVGWLDKDNRFHARAFVIDQEVTDNRNLAKYVRSIDEVEALTDLDFYHELPDPEEDKLESARPSQLWVD